MAVTTMQSFQGDCIVDMSIANPYSGKPEPLLKGNLGVCKAAETTETLNTWKTWSHRWLLTSPQVFTQVVRPFAESPQPLIWMRMGMRAGAHYAWSGWDAQLILKAVLDPAAASGAKGGAWLTLISVDLLYLLEQQNQVRARQGTIAEIAQEVASDVYDRFIVEPTLPGRHAYIQSYESGLSFLHRLMPAAMNRDGASNYGLYARAGSFHFHTPGYQVPEVRRIVYQQQSSSDANDLLLSVNTQSPEAFAGQGLTLIAHDALAGTSPVFVAPATNQLQLAPEVPRFATAARSRFITRHIGPNQLQEAHSRALYQFTAERMNFFRACFTLTNQPFAFVGDVLEFLNIYDPAFNGLWYVVAVTHVLEGSLLKSTLSFSREGFTPTSISLLSNTGGRRLTLGEIAASARTRRATGDETLPDGSVVKPVLPSG